jgi:hypothetical protein
MTAAVDLLLLAVAAGALFFALAPLIKGWWKARGERLVTCPEAQEPAAVEIDPVDAAFQALLKTREIHLQSCTRWPEGAGCGQKCMDQITAIPNGCLIRSILAEWHEGKSCVTCGLELSAVFNQQQTALISPERVTLDWADLRVEGLSETLMTHQPICWDCHIVETLYRMHPEATPERAPHKPAWD